MQTLSALFVAVLACSGIAWSYTELRPSPVRILPATAHTRSRAEVHTPAITHSGAFQTLQSVQRPALDRALFLRSFASPK